MGRGRRNPSVDGWGLGRLILTSALLPVWMGVAINAATDVAFPPALVWMQQDPWAAVGIGFGLIVALGCWEAWRRDRQIELVDVEQSRYRERLIRETHRIWIQGTLTDLADHKFRIILRLVNRPTSVVHPTHSIRGTTGGNGEVKPDASRRDLFEENGERLLILGEPGTGKTTMLLELAQDLVMRAREDPGRAAPVVLTLATFPGQASTDFHHWAAMEIRKYYDIPVEVAKYLLSQNMVVLLLDGLDEVTGHRVKNCVMSLNRFRANSPDIALAVTCRTQDYRAVVRPLLRMVAAVEIEQLTPAEAISWLAAGGHHQTGLQSLIAQGGAAAELLLTPLALSIAAKAFPSREITGPLRIDDVFAGYIDRMIDYPQVVRHSPYTVAEVRTWMAVLAEGSRAAGLPRLGGWLPSRITARWAGTGTIPWRRLHRLAMLGSIPIAFSAALASALSGRWLFVVAACVLVATSAWAHAGLPAWFAAGHLNFYDRDRHTSGEDARLRRVAPLGLSALALTGAAATVSLGRSEFERMSQSPFEAVTSTMVLLGGAFIMSGMIYVGLAPCFALGRQFSEGFFELLHRLTGEVAGTILGACLAGACGGIAATVLLTACSSAVEHSLSGAAGGQWDALKVLLAAGACAAAGGVVKTGQVAVNEAVVPRAFYRHLANEGRLPPKLDPFLAWSARHILVRRSGAEYTFLHGLYRDWWAGQRPAAHSRRAT